MKAKDLMIGDWILPNGETNPQRVNGLTINNISIESKGFLDGESLATPIQLTEEILELNGFKDYKEIREYKFEEDGDEYRFYLKKLYDIDGKFSCWGTNIGGVLPSLIYNVHELQHALRLSGLNELADKFKVKEI